MLRKWIIALLLAGLLVIPVITASGDTLSVYSIAGTEIPVRSIGNITKVTIPDSVTNISLHMPGSLRGLTEITVSPDHPTWIVIDGALINKEDRQLIRYCCGRAETVCTIPAFVRSIGAYAFRGASSLERITFRTASLPSGITRSVAALPCRRKSFCVVHKAPKGACIFRSPCAGDH